MTQLNRRSVLRNGGLTIGAASLIPLAPNNVDAELLRIGQAGLDYALTIRGHNRKRQAAYKKTRAICDKQSSREMTREEKWALFKRLSKATGYSALAREYGRNHTNLRKQLTAVARIPARTPRELRSRRNS